MSEMVARVAIELAAEYRNRLDEEGEFAWTQLARVAIQAMRIPPEHLAAAGADAIEYAENGGLLGGADEMAYNMWVAMIDEALIPTPKRRRK